MLDKIKMLLGGGGGDSGSNSGSSTPRKAAASPAKQGGAAKAPRTSAKQRPAAAPRKPQNQAANPTTRSAAPVFGGAEQQKAPPQVQKAPGHDPQRKAGYVVADKETLAEIMAYSGHVITAEGGTLNITPRQRQSVAILGDGTLLVDKTDPLTAHVSGVKMMAKRAGVTITRELLVDLDVIRKVYEGSRKRDTSGSREGTKMQQEFLDLVARAAKVKASDIHIQIGRYEGVVRVRSGGIMRNVGQWPAAHAHDLLAAAFNMADASDPQYRLFEYQAARISEINVPLPEGVQAIRLQFNPLSDGGRHFVARLLYSQSVAEGGDIDELGYSPMHVRQIKKMRKVPFGVVIISGPTGSGKSTTLQRALTALVREKRNRINVLTIEDPPEYVIDGAVQLPVTNAQNEDERNEKFRQAISASLRSDPDTIMIGEVRDTASAKLAFQAAMTGHGVWCSLHANDAVSILDRMRDLKVEVYKMTDHTLVVGLIGQRLIKKLCPHCKIPLEKGFRDLKEIEEETYDRVDAICGGDTSGIFMVNEIGCDHCDGGYSGRTVVAEVIRPDAKFMEFVRNDDKINAVKHWIEKLEGMTLLEHAVSKMVQGIVDPRDVEDTVGDIGEFDIENRLALVTEVAAQDSAQSSGAKPSSSAAKKQNISEKGRDSVTVERTDEESRKGMDEEGTDR